METVMERECSALGGLFQTVIGDMKGSSPVWDDFISKASKLQSQLRRVEASQFESRESVQQKLHGQPEGPDGRPHSPRQNTPFWGEVHQSSGCQPPHSRHANACVSKHVKTSDNPVSKRRSTTSLVFLDCLINPLQEQMEEWKRVANTLDKDHAKEYKKARQEIKKRSSDTLKLQKKAKKADVFGRGDLQPQLDSAKQDVSDKYLLLEETEKQAVRKALVEERSRFCCFVSMLKPVVEEEMSMLGEITHLQTLTDDLKTLTMDPHKLPASSEQVRPSEPSRPPDLDPRIGGRRDGRGGGGGGGEEWRVEVGVLGLQYHSLQTEGSVMVEPVGQLKGPYLGAVRRHGGRGLGLEGVLGDEARVVGGDGGEAGRRLLGQHRGRGGRGGSVTEVGGCCVLPTVSDCDYYSVGVDQDGEQQSAYLDKSSTIPRNSDIGQSYRRLFQSKRPASTAGLPSNPSAMVTPGVATIRRTPSSKPNLRRPPGGVSLGPIPIKPPMIPVKTPTVPEHLGFPSRAPSEDGNSPRTPLSPPTTPLSPGVSSRPLSLRSGSWETQHQSEGSDPPTPPPQPGGRVSEWERQPLPELLEETEYSEVEDFLVAIRRGVRLKRTSTNDRSAPSIH
ncbi:protein MTSS 1-like [Etheostoma cragini]|uniref:protein MTSS 1-like n=1 Tax=Etheostoma cragini TaxID=417921 RepID=UPI00155E5637|nr:protein MTSS 1-like [Etheostoma cragini]